MKNYNDIEYKDYNKLSFTYREVYIKGIYDKYAVFCADFLGNKNAYLLSFFNDNFSKHIKNKNDFNKFITNFDKNINILNTITDTLVWNSSSTKDYYKDVNKTLLFNSTVTKPYYQNINKIYKVDTINFLIVEVSTNEVESLIKEYNESNHAFKYDLQNLKIAPNLKCGIWV